MKIKLGKLKTKFGTGVQIKLTKKEIATAIMDYLVARNINISGARTIRVNEEKILSCEIYVDPSGFVIHNNKKYSGRGTIDVL